MSQSRRQKVFGTYSSVVIQSCQICGSQKLKSILFLGYLPPVNQMHPIGSRPKEQPSYPAELLFCENCELVQLGLAVDPMILFPKEYPYTSSTTRVLRENFQDLYQEAKTLIPLTREDLIVDIGSNDGNLLSNFKDHHRVLGITPEEIGKIAVERGIPTIFAYFNEDSTQEVLDKWGKAKVVTATNVFAHIENVSEVVENILKILVEDGVFISESHYLLSLVEKVQYDTIYHEHLRYYSLKSLRYLLEKHGLEIFHVKGIPTHGGSIRVYAARKNRYPLQPSIAEMMKKEEENLSFEKLRDFKKKVVFSKLELMALLCNLKKEGKRIVGISAPSRASTLIAYTGINEDIVDSVMEIQGSYKIGKYIPGTLIPVVDEKALYEEQPDYALLFSWHIRDELIKNLKKRGYQGDFIVPLPQPEIIRNEER